MVPHPPLEVDAETKMSYLSIPAGGFVRCVPSINTGAPNGDVDDAAFRYWTISFEVQWTVTGEGGGFALFSPHNELAKADGPLYVSNLDGSIQGSPPPATAPPPEVKTEEGKEPDPAALAEAEQLRKAKAEELSGAAQVVTITGDYGSDRIKAYLDGQLAYDLCARRARATPRLVDARPTSLPPHPRRPPPVAQEHLLPVRRPALHHQGARQGRVPPLRLEARGLPPAARMPRCGARTPDQQCIGVLCCSRGRAPCRARRRASASSPSTGSAWSRSRSSRPRSRSRPT